MISDLITGAIIGLIAVAIRFVFQKIRGPKEKKQKKIPAPAEAGKEPVFGSFREKKPEEPTPGPATAQNPEGHDPYLTIPEPVEAFYPPHILSQPPVPPAAYQSPVQNGGFTPPQAYKGTIPLDPNEAIPGGKYLGQNDPYSISHFLIVNEQMMYPNIPLGEVYDTKAGERVLRLRDGKIMIGRNPDCTYKIPAETAGVSGYHCILKCKYVAQHPVFCGYIVEVMDCNSTYGTYLGNGQRLIPNQPYRLKKGDSFFLGAPNGLGFTAV